MPCDAGTILYALVIRKWVLSKGAWQNAPTWIYRSGNLLKSLFSGMVAGSISLYLSPLPAIAQSRIIPDNTLGSEHSTVIQNFNGTANELITGGALRGNNLFHSFQSFNVSEGRGAFFISPGAGVDNILARVTGGDRSTILGTLGVAQLQGNRLTPSSANLFLINPNGILLGPNASLDIGGSFVASTANALQFDDLGTFSTSQPEAPVLLTIHPSTLLFSQRAAGRIEIQSQNGLAVPTGESLLLVGGDVVLNRGRLFAPGGRLELGGLAAPGRVGLEVGDRNLRLGFPDDIARANVLLHNGSGVLTLADGGGQIVIHAHNLNILEGSALASGLAPGLGAEGRRAGNVVLDVSDRITVADASGILNFGLPNSIGDSGDVQITAQSLRLLNGSQINTGTIGQGNGGGIRLRIADQIVLSGRASDGTPSAIVSGVVSPLLGVASLGRGGVINIQGRSLTLADGAQITASTNRAGRGGDIRLQITDAIRLTENSALSTATVGQEPAGNLTLITGRLSVRNGSSLSASTAGAGRGGDIAIRAAVVELVGVADDRLSASEITTQTTGAGIVGDGGTVTIHADRLSLRDGGSILTSTVNDGRGGDITITADRIELIGTSDLSRGAGFRSQLSSEAAGFGGTGDAGTITLFTDQLQVLDGARVSTLTLTDGQGGDINITADTIELVGISADGQFPTGVGSEAQGVNTIANAGDITIATRRLSILDGAVLTAATASLGRGGAIAITASETIELNGTGVLNNGEDNRSRLSTETFGVGRAGDMTLTTAQLTVSNGAAVSASTFGNGDGGAIQIAADTIHLSGTSADGFVRSGIGSETVADDATGNAGSVTISTQQVRVQDGALISTTTRNLGDAGDLQIHATDVVEVIGTSGDGQFRSGLSALVNQTGSGQGGNLFIATRRLSVRQGASVSVSTLGLGDAGRLMIQAEDSVEVVGRSPDGAFPSQLSASAESTRAVRAGDLAIATAQLTLDDHAQITVSSQNSEPSGSLFVTAPSIRLDHQSRLIAETASGDGGNIRLSGLDTLLLRRGSTISTTAGTAQSGGDGGNVTIRADAIVAVPRENSDITANAFTGRGGRVAITTQQLFGIAFRDRLTPLSDITASSEFGISGEVIINTPDVDPSRGLVGLPSDVTDATQQIAQTCSAGAIATNTLGSFTVTGRGGLPPNPTGMLDGNIGLTGWVVRNGTGSRGVEGDRGVWGDRGVGGDGIDPSTLTLSNSLTSLTSPTFPIEAQGWFVDAEGKISLVAQVPGSLPSSDQSLQCANASAPTQVLGDDAEY